MRNGMNNVDDTNLFMIRPGDSSNSNSSPVTAIQRSPEPAKSYVRGIPDKASVPSYSRAGSPVIPRTRPSSRADHHGPADGDNVHIILPKLEVGKIDEKFQQLAFPLAKTAAGYLPMTESEKRKLEAIATMSDSPAQSPDRAGFLSQQQQHEENNALILGSSPLPHLTPNHLARPQEQQQNFLTPESAGLSVATDSLIALYDRSSPASFHIEQYTPSCPPKKEQQLKPSDLLAEYNDSPEPEKFRSSPGVKPNDHQSFGIEDTMIRYGKECDPFGPSTPDNHEYSDASRLERDDNWMRGAIDTASEEIKKRYEKEPKMIAKDIAAKAGIVVGYSLVAYGIHKGIDAVRSSWNKFWNASKEE